MLRYFDQPGVCINILYVWRTDWSFRQVTFAYITSARVPWFTAVIHMW